MIAAEEASQVDDKSFKSPDARKDTAQTNNMESYPSNYVGILAAE